ncbi:MAG: nucleotidyltransferase domain-containing protein [Chloroflexi bacterium]|nr:MAG: nucleotidyltransferase domain-containing protein [Chloroflexota bacterium]
MSSEKGKGEQVATKLPEGDLLQRILEKIVRGYAPERVILFGSYAYGEPRPESDIDLLIIKETERRPLERWVELKRLLRDRNRLIAVSPLVYTPEEVRERLAMGDMFLEEVLKSGEVLYERPSGSRQ